MRFPIEFIPPRFFLGSLGLLGLFSFLSESCSHTQIQQGSTPTSLQAGPQQLERLGLKIWAHEGGDKVTADEQRATQGPERTKNTVWDGQQVRLFGSRNEVVSFNLVLEASHTFVPRLSLRFASLSDSHGHEILSEGTSSTPRGGDELFQWTQRPIEIFLVRYLPILGLSRLSYELYDERHIPERFQRPFAGKGFGSGTWNDRPHHNKLYPEIAVPFEAAKGEFSIARHRNQSIWIDIYIRKGLAPGIYRGDVVVTQDDQPVSRVPVSLEVLPLTLPDEPTAKTMVYLGSDLNTRYFGSHPVGLTDEQIQKIRDHHFLLAHRHKISLIDGDPGLSPAPFHRPRDPWVPRLNGSLFSPDRGYDGPGVGTGNGVYSIGSYGSWKQWPGLNEDGSNLPDAAKAWAQWFEKNAPRTESFLYLVDESLDYGKTEALAKSLKSTGLHTFATLPLPSAVKEVPSLTDVASWVTVGPTALWDQAHSRFLSDPRHRFIAYNGKRPANGSFAIEDDGVALRELAWAQAKMGVHRWFFWESTYYKDFQNGRGETNVFQSAQTFGGPSEPDPVTGRKASNYSNGDGVLFYPGTDRVFPDESYEMPGPIASLRLKHWRRGIQDIDYFYLASQKDKGAAQRVLVRMVPKALWEYGIDDPKDPTWVRTPISWSTNPDDWEKARRELAEIALGKSR